MAMQIPKSALLVAIPLALFAVRIVQRRRSSTLASREPHDAAKAPGIEVKIPVVAAKIPKIGSRIPSDGAKIRKSAAGVPEMLGAKMAQGRTRAWKMPMVGAKSRSKRHKPKSRLRYYGIGLLIGALERDTTRKAVVGALKLAQRRA